MSDRLRSMIGDMASESSADLSPSYRVWRKTGAIVVVDEHADVPLDTIIWHFARILAWVKIGADVSIGAGTEIGRGSMIGDGTRISANCFLPSHSVIGKNVFIGPGTVFTDDRMPRVLKPGEPPYIAEPPTIDDDASVGAGCVIIPGVRIGMGALVGAGSVISRDVEPHTQVRGEPARITVTRPSP